MKEHVYDENAKHDLLGKCIHADTLFTIELHARGSGRATASSQSPRILQYLKKMFLGIQRNKSAKGIVAANHKKLISFKHPIINFVQTFLSFVRSSFFMIYVSLLLRKPRITAHAIKNAMERARASQSRMHAMPETRS